MPKNFLMIVEITGIAALSCVTYVILRYSYYFQAKNQCVTFRDHVFNVVLNNF